MSVPRLALGIDVGSSNCKVVVIEIAADGSASELMIRRCPTPAGGERLRADVIRMVGELLDRTNAPVEAVGIASMGETGVPLDEDGTALGDLIRWDTASGRNGRGLVEAFGERALFERTGVPVAAKSSLAMWWTLNREDRDRWDAMRSWAGAAELIALELTGSLMTDHTLAARTMAYRLPDAASPPASVFDDELLAAVGVRSHQLAQIHGPDSSGARVTTDASARTGLAVGTPVVVAGHDHAVGAWAADVRRPGDAADSVGTAEALIRVAAPGVDRMAAKAQGMSIARTVDGDQESLLAGHPSAGALVDWLFTAPFRGADRSRTAWAAAAQGADPSEKLVMPYPRGRQSPAPDADARFRVSDRSGHDVLLDESPEAALRSVLQGLCLHIRWADAAQTVIVGAPATGVTVLGGPGGGDPAWWELKKAIMPVRLNRLDCAEPVAAGAALLAAIRAGVAAPDSALTAAAPGSALTAAARDGGTERGECSSTSDFDASYADFVEIASRRYPQPTGEE
jgi:xylulokinase